MQQVGRFKEIGPEEDECNTFWHSIKLSYLQNPPASRTRKYQCRESKETIFNRRLTELDIIIPACPEQNTVRSKILLWLLYDGCKKLPQRHQH